MAILEHQNFSNGKNESNKSDFNEALEHNLEVKTSEKDRVLTKTTNKVLFPQPQLFVSMPLRGYQIWF